MKRTRAPLHRTVRLNVSTSLPMHHESRLLAPSSISSRLLCTFQGYPPIDKHDIVGAMGLALSPMSIETFRNQQSDDHASDVFHVEWPSQGSYAR